jgi:hypothetical protein
MKYNLEKNIPSFEGHYRPTLNHKGFMLTKTDPLIDAFIKEATLDCNRYNFALDVGAAYGIATLAVLEKGGKIIANDTNEEHLNEIKTKSRAVDSLNLMLGDIRHDIKLKPNSISCILISRVLHFFYGEEIINCLKKMHLWLKPNGKIFVSNETPYFGTVKNFIPIYERLKLEGHSWPGLIESLDYFCSEKAPFVSLPIHLFDKDLCQKVTKESGFNLVDLFYINRENAFPSNALFDGRESIAFIAQKTNTGDVC